MNPILDLLNRIFIASPTLALEEVKHLFEQYMRDIQFWKGKACSWQAEAEAHIEQNKELLDENSRLFEQGAEVSRDLAHSEAQYASLLDQKQDLEKRLHGYDLDMRGMCSMKDTADARIAELEAQVTALNKRLGNVVPPPDDSFEDIEF